MAHDNEFDELYETCFPSVERFVCSHGGNSDDAWDTFQDAVVALWEHMRAPDFKLRPGVSVRDYLRGIARNMWFGNFRKTKKMDWTGLDEFVEKLPVPESEIPLLILREEMFDVINKARKQQGDRCQKLIALFWDENKTHAEITQIMGFDHPGSSRVALARCMEELRRIAGGMLGNRH
ncbi:MAG: sigma-70 family RNA polymerase sigma factor [Saprospiraceae bacterium]|jgi:RNA polymerase sigma factor (sigma-70 family)|nr:sigma-70 family RNA polymerase sigma factor [Saprospiraceae bacterium]